MSPTTIPGSRSGTGAFDDELVPAFAQPPRPHIDADSRHFQREDLYAAPPCPETAHTLDDEIDIAYRHRETASAERDALP